MFQKPLALRSGPPYCLLILSVLLASACGKDSPGDAPESFQALSRGLVPSGRLQSGTWTEANEQRPETRIIAADEAGGYWLESAIPTGAFEQSGIPGVWRAVRPFPGAGRPLEGPWQTLVGNDGEYPYVPRMPRTPPVGIGVFSAAGAWVLVVRHPSLGPPGDQVLREYLQTSHSDGTHSRVTIGSLEADGFALLPGEGQEFTLRVPPQSALSFWTTARNSARGGETGEQVRFQVEINGALAFEHDQPLDNPLNHQVHRIPLPAEGGDALSVVFRVQGDPARAAILVPGVQPLEIGRPGARPWEAERENIVLLQGDTFRADNLSAYGGDPRIAPVLNQLGDRSRVYTDMSSTASWTVPAHATLLTGLLPHQTGCVGTQDSLAPEVLTLAERLRAVGYRTIAITDQGFVSRSQGFAQGFEWFFELGREGAGSFQSTLRDVAEQLAFDDGRPLFLFVQTYRAHVPYAVTDETRATLGEDFSIVGTWEDLQRDYSVNTMQAGEPGFEQFVDLARGLYVGGVHDLDQGIGSFLEMVASAGFLRQGTLFFTSDHGEAFGEHGCWGHGTTVYQEEIAVPLLVLGDKFPAGTTTEAASLLDLPPTILDLAGLQVPKDWRGRSLLDEDQAHTRYATTGLPAGLEGGGRLAAMRQGNKLILPDLDSLGTYEAYDLAADPDENHDLAAEETKWAEELAAQTLRQLSDLITPRVKAGVSQRSVAEENRLDDLGY